MLVIIFQTNPNVICFNSISSNIGLFYLSGKPICIVAACSRWPTTASQATPHISTCESSRLTSCSIKIVKFWLCVELFLQDKNPLVFEDVTDLAVFIQKISEFSGSDRTGFHTGRIPAISNPLDAECAFLDYSLVARPVTEKMSVGIDIFSRQLDFPPIEIARSIGTSGHAAAAADTPIVIDDDNAIRLGPGSSDRAAFHTNGISALLALDWEVKMPFIRYFLVVVIHVSVYEIYALLFFHF
jgi:hypothetical protein